MHSIKAFLTEMFRTNCFVRFYGLEIQCYHNVVNKCFCLFEIQDGCQNDNSLTANKKNLAVTLKMVQLDE